MDEVVRLASSWLDRRRIVSPMSDEHPNALAYRRTADAFRSADEVALAALIAVDVVWHVPGTHPMAGDIRGRDQLVAWLTELRAKGFWLTEHDVLGNDEHVCALSIMGARRDGIDVQTRVVSVFHYREGQQHERWFYPEDRAAWGQIFAE
jgi:ketosteroid isomerase-like protein